MCGTLPLCHKDKITVVIVLLLPKTAVRNGTILGAFVVNPGLHGTRRAFLKTVLQSADANLAGTFGLNPSTSNRCIAVMTNLMVSTAIYHVGGGAVIMPHQSQSPQMHHTGVIHSYRYHIQSRYHLLCHNCYRVSIHSAHMLSSFSSIIEDFDMFTIARQLQTNEDDMKHFILSGRVKSM